MLFAGQFIIQVLISCIVVYIYIIDISTKKVCTWERGLLYYIRYVMRHSTLHATQHIACGVPSSARLACDSTHVHGDRWWFLHSAYHSPDEKRRIETIYEAGRSAGGWRPAIVKISKLRKTLTNIIMLCIWKETITFICRWLPGMLCTVYALVPQDKTMTGEEIHQTISRPVHCDWVKRLEHLCQGHGHWRCSRRSGVPAALRLKKTRSLLEPFAPAKYVSRKRTTNDVASAAPQLQTDTVTPDITPILITYDLVCKATVFNCSNFDGN